jgi:hypothetical protein
MPSHSTAQFSEKQQAAALLLASGKSVRDTAAEVNAGVRTIYGWRENPDFRELVQGYQGEMIEVGLGRLANAVTQAVDTLTELLKSEESDSVRARAANDILNHFISIRGHVTLGPRIAELERMVNRESGEPT